jgi:HEAT repeat protein
MFRSLSKRRTLVAALRDLDEASVAVRVSAIADLVHHATDARSQVVARLEQALRSDHAAVRGAAALALADLRAVESLPPLLFAVEDDDAHVRQMALTALGEIGDGRARERLRRALGDERPEVRFQAIVAFVRVAPDEADSALMQALSDADPNVRYIGLRAAEEHADSSDTALSSLILERVRSILGDPEPRVRAAAAILLARTGDRTGEAVLLDVVAGRLRTSEPEDEAEAVELAGALRLDRAVLDLERRAFGLRRLASETFAFQARVSLAKMGHARAGREILRDLSGWSRHRRTLAVAAAGRARLGEALPLIEAMRGRDDRADQAAVNDALTSLADA